MPFDNAQFELRISGTTADDRRIMSFIDFLWGFEVTGGKILTFSYFNFTKENI